MAAKTTDFPVKQRQLNEDIKNGTFKQCYLIYGEEAYLRNQNRDKLVKALAGDVNSMNFNRYEGDKLGIYWMWRSHREKVWTSIQRRRGVTH